MNALVPLNGGMPSIFQSMAGLPDMNAAAQAGMSASFGVIGFKGKNWRIKHRGEEILVKDDRGNPAPTLDVIIVGISPNISKQWYEKKYTEGDDASPDCFSIDGVTPDASSPKKQCASCAVCPANQWGSRITEAGKKAKACQDSRRLAVVPSGDVRNESFGGPMLLRLPPTSLQNLAGFSRELTRFGAQPFMVQTILGFDHNMAYPMITFKASGWVTDEDTAMALKDVLEDPLIEQMLAEEATVDAGQPETSALAAGGPAAGLAAGGGATGVSASPVVAPVGAASAPAPAPAQQPLAQAQPVAQPAASVTPAPAAPTAQAVGRASPFSSGAKPAAPAPAVTGQAASTPVVVAPVAEPVAEVVQVQQAPPDLEAAIDDLLNG